MGARQKMVANILSPQVTKVYLPTVVKRSLFTESIYHKKIERVYKLLGGIQEHYPIGFGLFDIISDGFFIELDEENHFNRYRKITLQSPFYKNHYFFSVTDYIYYCDKFENRARSYKKFWTSSSSEEQFGVSSPSRIFDGNGSARWKQRAFYDFLKDVYSLITGKPVLRFSIYDSIGELTIDKILKKGIGTERLMDLVQGRLMN